jgi:hypothetical protein
MFDTVLAAICLFLGEFDPLPVAVPVPVPVPVGLMLLLEGEDSSSPGCIFVLVNKFEFRLHESSSFLYCDVLRRQLALIFLVVIADVNVNVDVDDIIVA